MSNGKCWQPEDDARLIALAERLGFREAARILGVSQQSAQKRTEHLGVKIGHYKSAAYRHFKKSGRMSASLRGRPENAW